MHHRNSNMPALKELVRWPAVTSCQLGKGRRRSRLASDEVTVEAIIANRSVPSSTTCSPISWPAMNDMTNGLHRRQPSRPRTRCSPRDLAVRTTCSQLIEDVRPLRDDRPWTILRIAEAVAERLRCRRLRGDDWQLSRRDRRSLEAFVRLCADDAVRPFFDEFDVLGKERGDTHETGEIKRVVSSLLPDRRSSQGMAGHRAPRPWRRFQVRMELPKPDDSPRLTDERS